MRVFVLADDLTGANATASLLKRQGLPSHTHIFGREWAGDTPASLHEDGIHVLDLDTRDRGDNETSDRIAIVAAKVGDTADLFGLRIDSTLRGPIPASLNTLLCDTHRLALVVPAFPASGRTTLGGIHYVNGTPLAETEVAHDPVCPVTASSVTEWIGARLRVPWATLGLAEVRSGRVAMIARLNEQLAEGARAVFFDAQTDLDIDEIARAALAIGRDHRELSLLPVDPGPFTAAVLRAMREPVRLSPWVLGIVGSMMETSRQQMDFVEAGGYAYTVAYRGQPASELLAAFEAAPLCTKALLLRTDTADLDANATLHLYENLTALFALAIERFPTVGGYFLSGGETAGRLLAAFGVQSLRMQSEILPLISLSRIVDGRLRGALLVTKGGAVGGKSAIADALGRLYDALVDDGAASPARLAEDANRTTRAAAAQQALAALPAAE
ncbi:MAG: four-carbon acid sugar kinase family protein [Acetobacteraceae bacterium]|nr:four-carbon acid sugar kinase family protein [Acetobacteraceae bacterium]